MLLQLLLLAVLNRCECQVIGQQFYQNNYEIILDRATMTWMNADMVNVAEIKVYKYNRTMKVADLTIDFREDVYDMKSHCIGYKFSANQYVKTAIQFNLDICKALKMDLIGYGMAKTKGNFTNCPLKKGTYKAVGIYVTNEKLPPSIPEMKFRLQNLVYLGGVHSYDWDLYGEIRYYRNRSRFGWHT